MSCDIGAQSQLLNSSCLKLPFFLLHLAAGWADLVKLRMRVAEFISVKFRDRPPQDLPAMVCLSNLELYLGPGRTRETTCS